MESKNRMRAAWEAGDFGEIARLQEAHGEEFVARLGLKPGMRVLDVGCGTGNQTIPAARTGARVTGLDLAANLLAQGQDRARNEELDILWIQGDAEQLRWDRVNTTSCSRCLGQWPRPGQKELRRNYC